MKRSHVLRRSSVLAWIVLLVSAGPAGAVISVPGDFTSIMAAMSAATEGEEVVVNSNGPFVEPLRLHPIAPNVHLRAGQGFTPMVVGDATIAWGDLGVVSQEGKLVFVQQNTDFTGIHFRIDVTGLSLVNGTFPYQVLKIGTGSSTCTDCIFEFYGDPAEPFAVGDSMVRVEGGDPSMGHEVVFNNCEWRYTNMTPLEWPAFNNSLACLFGGVKVELNDCTFQQPPDTGGRARNIGSEGGPQTNLILNRVGFLGGANTSQAFIAGANLLVTADQCVFGPGAGRQVGTGGSANTVTLNRCLFNPTSGAAFLPDPGNDTIMAVNSVIHFRSTGQPPITGSESRKYVFRHCTFVDLEGAEGSGARLCNTDGTEIIEMSNNLYSAPTSIGLLQGTNPHPSGPFQGNLCDVNGAQEAMPAAGYTVGNPGLDADNIHLTDSSDAIAAGVDLGITEDYDGETRPGPSGSNPDIGADERSAPSSVEKWTLY